MQLLQAAGRDHVPINPSSSIVQTFVSSLGKEPPKVPASSDRPSVDDVLAEIQEEVWYREQIKHNRLFEAREAQLGVIITDL